MHKIINQFSHVFFILAMIFFTANSVYATTELDVGALLNEYKNKLDAEQKTESPLESRSQKAVYFKRFDVEGMTSEEINIVKSWSKPYQGKQVVLQQVIRKLERYLQDQNIPYVFQIISYDEGVVHNGWLLIRLIFNMVEQKNGIILLQFKMLVHLNKWGVT